MLHANAYINNEEMKAMHKKTKIISGILVFLMVGFLIGNTEIIKAIAATCNYIMEIRYQGRNQTDDQSDTENAVPQSMAGNGSTIYLLKNRENKDSSLDDRSYIVKILNANTSSPQLVLPADAAYVGHGNGMTYYNGYLYVAHGESAKLYRVREEENSTTAYDPSTEWKKGTIHYEKNTLTLSGVNSDEKIRNIAHYTGNYFIVCLKSSYSGTTNTLTYGVGLLEGTTFTIKKRFTVVATDTYSAVQDIDYSDGYLWAVLYKSDDTMNNIHLIEIPTSFSAIENGKTYSVKKTVGINKNEKGRANTKNEMESVYVYGSNFYTWSNIREGWYETFCRYSRFPNGVTITSVTAKSESSLEIKWNSVSYADQYRIDRRIEGGEFSTVTTVDGSKTSYTDTNLTAGTKYYYRVYGLNSAGTSPKKDGFPGITKTVAPKISAVTPLSESELKIKWNAVTGAKKYIVCRKKEGTGEGWEYYERVKELTATEYTDTGLEPNTLYYYGIIAVTETGVESGGTNGNPGSDNRMSGRTLEAIMVSLNKSNLELVAGESYTLAATVTPAYAANSQVSWTSSDSAVVSIDQTGQLTALQSGTAVITAREQRKNKTATCSVTVNEPDQLDIGEDQTLLNGTYRIRMNGTTQVLAVQNQSNEDGAEVGILQENEDDDYQVFRFEYVSDGYYMIKNVGSEKYLQDMGTDGSMGINIQQMAPEMKPEQLWNPVQKNGLYYLVPQSANNLVVNIGDTDDNLIEHANLWIPKNKAYQLFELVPVELEMNEADFVLPEDLTEIEESAFEGIDAKIVYVPDNCASIGTFAFRNSSVKQIRIPANCLIEEDAFTGCERVIVFGAAGSSAETYCEGKENLTFMIE